MGVTSLPRQTDQPTSDRPFANVLATILLTVQPASVVSSTANLTLDPNAAPIDTPPPPPPPPPPPTPVVPEGTFVPYVPPPPKPVAPPLPPAPSVATTLTDWYRQLITFRHGNAALRSGTITMLDFDQQNALVWVARPATISTLTPPVIVACNLSSASVGLSIGAALKTLNLRGTYLRTLLRSDKAMGPQDLNNVILPPYSIYIGELRR